MRGGNGHNEASLASSDEILLVFVRCHHLVVTERGGDREEHLLLPSVGSTILLLSPSGEVGGNYDEVHLVLTR